MHAQPADALLVIHNHKVDFARRSFAHGFRISARRRHQLMDAMVFQRTVCRPAQQRGNRPVARRITSDKDDSRREFRAVPLKPIVRVGTVNVYRRHAHPKPPTQIAGRQQVAILPQPKPTAPPHSAPLERDPQESPTEAHPRSAVPPAAADPAVTIIGRLHDAQFHTLRCYRQPHNERAPHTILIISSRDFSAVRADA